ncbi:oxidoreductase [uncultured Jatrophihabitans sp.]|uniref:oxidoreductase n=1 Tax=uncultured Jatrophihabitans sp. TaxID=1610747 RepID=UPI0035CA743A
MTETATLVGRPVHRIGFGAMQLPGKGVFGPPRDRDAALAVLRRAIELGVNHIDTAQYYGPDVSNELIHAALHPYPDDLVLVTKVGGDRDDKGGWIGAQRPEQLRAGVEANLRSLQIERIDAVNLRRMDEHTEGADESNDQHVPLADQLAELVALRDEGKIGGIGLSTVDVDQLREGLDYTDIVCVQNAYNLRQRDDQPVFDLCRERGIPYVPYFPLGSAFGVSVHVTQDDAVKSVAQRLGVTATQVGLAWLLAQSDNVLLIPGTSSVEHLEENLGAGDVTLDDEALAELG